MHRLSRALLINLLVLSHSVLAQEWRSDSKELSLAVRLSQGALDISLPTPELPATQGFAPSLRLAYGQSATDFGEGFGPGWALRTSSIDATLDQGGMIHASADRVGKNSGDFKNSLELDGQRLIWLSSDLATRTSRYTVEHSSQMLRIIRHDRPFTVKLYAGSSQEREVTVPHGFRVIDPDGTERIYSGDLSVAEGFVTNTVAKFEYSRTFISRWPLVYELRPGANTIEYQYQKFGQSSFLQKVLFAYGRSSYVLEAQERPTGPISRAMGYMLDRRHLYTRLVACFDGQPQETWVFDYQNGPPTRFEAASCEVKPLRTLASEPDESSLWTRILDTGRRLLSEGLWTSQEPIEVPELRLARIHRFGSVVGDLDKLRDERKPSLAFEYNAPVADDAHVRDIVQDRAFLGFGPSGNLDFLDADQDGFLDLVQSSAQGSRMIRGQGGDFSQSAPEMFVQKDGNQSVSLGFNEEAFKQGSVQQADMDGDGWPDIIHIKANGTWSIYWNDRQGSFHSQGIKAQIDSGNGLPQPLEVRAEMIGFGRGSIMDIDGDQRADLIYPSLGSAGQLQWMVYLNRYDANQPHVLNFQLRRFAFPFRSTDTEILKRNDLRFADINSDGLIDLIKFSQNESGKSGICVHENLGRTAAGDTALFAGDPQAAESSCTSEVWHELPDSRSLAHRIHSVWLADMNGDGYLDVVDLNDDSQALSYWLGQTGHSGFSARRELALSGGAPIAIDPSNKYNSFPLDIDQDGMDEILFFETSTGTVKAIQFPKVKGGAGVGLITHIREEQGLDHWIQYRPLHSYGMKTGYGIPNPISVVSQIVSRDETQGTDEHQAMVANYEEPVWDSIAGSFLGFQRARFLEPGSWLMEGKATEDARLVDFWFPLNAQNITESRARAGRWSEKSIRSIPWTQKDELQFMSGAGKAPEHQALQGNWFHEKASMLWREKQNWLVQTLAAQALPDATAHIRPRMTVLLESSKVEQCEPDSLECSDSQQEEVHYGYDQDLRITQASRVRPSYRSHDEDIEKALDSQSLTKVWTYRDPDTSSDREGSILRLKSYQEFDDARFTSLAYQEDFDYLGGNAFAQPDSRVITLYRKPNQMTPDPLPESVMTRNALEYDAFGNMIAVRDASGREIEFSRYDAESGSLLLESHAAGKPRVYYCYSQRDCGVATADRNLSLPASGIAVSLIQNSSGAWEYRQWDPLRRPTSLQNEAGFHQTLRYQLNNIRSLESRTDQGKRQSVETYFADARQNMRLGALSGPNEGQTRLVGWTKLSRRGMPLLSGSPMLVTDPGNPISIIRKNLNLVPTGSHFRSYDALERLTSESLDQNQESLKVMYHAWGLTLGTLDYKDQPVDTIEVRRLDNVTTMIQDSTNQKHFFGRNIRGAMESVLLSGEEKPRRYLSYGGRLLAESQIPGIRRTSYHYDESLLVKEQHVRDGHDQLAATLHYEYDVQKRLREVRNQDKQLVSAYTYQADSLETAIQSDPKQALIVKRTYERDEEGRILHEKVLYTDHAGKILHQGEESYAYTEDGLLSQRINPFSVRFDYAYSPDRTLRSLHMTQGNRKVELFQASAYDALGLLHEAHYADGNLIAQWDHDPITTMEQGSRLCQARDGRCLSTWDENLLRSRSGLMVERTRQHPEGEDFESFSYSPRNEILFGDLNGASENFSYNSFGGSEPKDSGAPLPSPLPPQGQHRIYDQLGRLQKTQTIHDIVYSEVDRPLSIRKDAATIDLGYDAAGQLSYRGQNTDGLVAPLYLPFTDSVSSPEDDLQTLVLPGSMQVKFSHKKEALTWQWLDAQGTPLMTLDATGNFLRRHQRQIYGKRLDSQTENLEVLPIDFAGQRLDSETGFVYFGDRWFDTVEGRFITPDALAMDQPTLCLAAQWMDCNLYSYRSNNPLAQ